MVSEGRDFAIEQRGGYIFTTEEVEIMIDICKDWFHCPHIGKDLILDPDEVIEFQTMLEGNLAKG